MTQRPGRPQLASTQQPTRSRQTRGRAKPSAPLDCVPTAACHRSWRVSVELAASDWDERPGLLESAWRYRRVRALVVRGGVRLGFALSLLQPLLYEGTARALLVPPSGDSGLDPGRY